MFSPGTLVQNRYRVLRVLGAGGFGQVFEVSDNGTPKVLKVLNLSALRPSQRQKAIALFQREVEFLSQFHHPGIPTIEPDGYFVVPQDQHPALHCLVMEKIEGPNLQQWRRQGNPLSQEQAIDWLKQLISILAPLHQRQFFHRDIKPANIMLRPTGQLVLIDFGAVREMTLTYLVKQRQQETGTAIISAGYTPPEQAEGRAVPQSDFFAIGRTFVYLFTGKDPIDLPKDPQTGLLQWRSQTAHVSPLLANLVDQLMAPLPGQRPQGCDAIFKMIRTIERQLFLQRWIPQIVWWARLRQQPGRDRLSLRSTVMTAIATSLLLSGSVVWSNRMALSNGLNDRGLDAYKAENNTLAWWHFQASLVLNPKNPSALFNLGDLYESKNQLEQARIAYRKAASTQAPKAYNNLGHLELISQNPDQAFPLLEAGLQLLERQRDRYSSTEFSGVRYSLLKNLGWAYLTVGQYRAAEIILEQAIALNSQQAAAHCLLVPALKANVKISRAFVERNRCYQYANSNNPDTQRLMALVRTTFPESEVQR